VTLFLILSASSLRSKFYFRLLSSFDLFNKFEHITMDFMKGTWMYEPSLGLRNIVETAFFAVMVTAQAAEIYSLVCDRSTHPPIKFN
jgi:hypothetical protein